MLLLGGRIVDAGGDPVPGVCVEIWQANAFGRYDHVSDGNPAPLDPNFLGSGAVVTGSDGRYQFRTVVPGSYEVVPGWRRAPHVHFQLTGRCDRHVTQMWFPSEPLNAQDRLWLALTPADRERVSARVLDLGSDSAPCIVEFSIVIPNG